MTQVADLKDALADVVVAAVRLYNDSNIIAMEHAARVDALVNELVLARAEAQGAQSMMLDVQQDCVRLAAENRALRDMLIVAQDTIDRLTKVSAP